MKKSFNFSKSFEDNIYSYLYVRDDESFLEKSWQGLSDPTISSIITGAELSNKPVDEYEKIVQAEDVESNQLVTKKTPFNQYCINNVNREEMAVYLGLIWRLSSKFSKYCIPSYYRETASSVLNQNYENINWEYAIECEDCYEDKGFQSADSWSNDEQRPVNGAGLFEINTFQDLVLVQNSIQGDASSNLNLFCLESERKKETFFYDLRDENRPELKNILRENEIFIDLAIGSDPGYCDVLLLKSKKDIEEQLNIILEEYKVSISKYEKNVGELKTLEQFLSAIAKMINIYPENQT